MCWHSCNSTKANRLKAMLSHKVFGISSALHKSNPLALGESDPPGERDWEQVWDRSHHSRRRRVGFLASQGGGEIIHATGVRFAFPSSAPARVLASNR